MFRCQCPNAKLLNDKLILSLPDAMTPVVWVMNMKDDKEFVMRIESSDNGLFILQKISNDGKKIEDIAYYPNRKKAIRALTAVTKRIKGSEGASRSKIQTIVSLIQFVLVSGASLGVLYILYTLFFGQIFDRNNVVDEQVIERSAPVIESDPNAVGVPMSADDFLKQNKNTGLPF